MALQKDLTLDNGVTVSYWKIGQYSGFANGLHTFTLDGYLNQTIRESNMLPVKSEVITIASEVGMAYRTNDANILSLFYTYLKNNDYRFQDSIDC